MQELSVTEITTPLYKPVMAEGLERREHTVVRVSEFQCTG